MNQYKLGQKIKLRVSFGYYTPERVYTIKHVSDDELYICSDRGCTSIMKWELFHPDQVVTFIE
jgi:hypothetical protein